jgi:hypothetical protein
MESKRRHHLKKITKEFLSINRLLIFIQASLLLGACSTNTPNPTETLTNQIPTIEATASRTAIPSPTTTSTPTPTTSPTPTNTPAPVVYGPTDFPENVNPLTGLIVEDESILERRPVAVKINIVPRTSNRPPWGLSFADIVYDYYHNDGYTRLHAIFYGKDAELVGPIRSGRLPDHELIRMYHSVFAYGSADRIINNRLLNAEYSNRLILEGSRSNCPPTSEKPLCRYDPGGYDFLLGDTQAMSNNITSQRVENNRQNLDGMSFYALTPEGGVAGDQLYVRYSGDDYLRWDYDLRTGRYFHFRDAIYDTGGGEEYEPLMDRLNDEQIAADNVIVVVARHEYYQQPPNEIIEILLSGTGTAYAFRDGYMYDVLWKRSTIDSVLSLSFPDGSDYYFKPGNTWIQVVGEFTQVNELEDGIWRYINRIP